MVWYVSASVYLYGVYVEFMHNAAWSVGIHMGYYIWSAAMCQRNKTQLVVYQKGYDGVEQYTGGCGGVFEGCHISDYNQIRERGEWQFPFHRLHQDAHL